MSAGWLCVIPARGGSKSVPRKNLRLVGGVPLVANAVARARQVPVFSTIVVSTDHPDVAAVARLAGAEVVPRSDDLAGDDVTLVDVVADVYGQVPEPDGGWEGIAVLQPTSPHLTPATITDALTEMVAEGWDSLMTVTPVLHHHWTDDGPVYRSRVNRQAMRPRLWSETGGLQAVRTFPAAGCTPAPDKVMVGGVHHLWEVGYPESIDVDTPGDLAVARQVADRRRVHFIVTAGDEVGSGHLRRCLAIADEVSHHLVAFGFAGETAEWAVDLVRSHFYPLISDPELEQGSWPDVLVVDALSAGDTVITNARARGVRVLALESTPGLADVTVNELDPPGSDPRVLTGPEWTILRPELVYLASNPPPVEPLAGRVLVTFGGTDPADLTSWAAVACSGWDVRVIAPPGGVAPVEGGVEVVPAPVSMAEQFAWADLVVTSQGRTVTEAAACGVPVVSVAANLREATHYRIPGVLYLGHHATVNDLGAVVDHLIPDVTERRWMARTARSHVSTRGTTAVATLIDNLAASTTNPGDNP